jgi:hypothetical protein
VITNAPVTGKKHHATRSSRASRLRAASSTTLPRQIVVPKPVENGHTRRERLMIVALVAVVLVDVLHWIVPILR